MSGDGGSSEKTEPPTQKKIRDARKKGQVSNSKEVVSAVLLSAIFINLWVMSNYYMQLFQTMVASPASLDYKNPFSYSSNALYSDVFITCAKIILPFLLTVIIFGILANFFQVGAIFAGEQIKPDLNRLNPVQGFKKIFSMKNVFESVKSIAKITVLSILIYFAIKRGFNDMIYVPSCGIDCVFLVMGSMLQLIIMYTIFCFIVLAVLDFFFQRYQYLKGLRMDKSEIKREYKESEGDPQIKSKRKSLHRELLSQSDTNNIKSASTVITNPTHYAVAIYYNEDTFPVPMVAAKGRNMNALYIIKIAKLYNIPIVQEPPLARALYREIQVGKFISEQFYDPVAKIIQFVNELKRQEEERDRL